MTGEITAVVMCRATRQTAGTVPRPMTLAATGLAIDGVAHEAPEQVLLVTAVETTLQTE